MILRYMAVSTVITSSTFIANLITRQKHNYLGYGILFAASLAAQALIFGKAEASELVDHKRFSHDYSVFLRHKEREIGYQGGTYAYKLNNSEKEKYERLEQEALEKAYDYYCQAQNKSMWIPDIQDRTKAEYCFSTAITMLSITNPMSKVVGTIVQLAGIYGIHVMREWNEINTLLNYSKHYYEQQEFYSDILKHYR